MRARSAVGKGSPGRFLLLLAAASLMAGCGVQGSRAPSSRPPGRRASSTSRAPGATASAGLQAIAMTTPRAGAAISLSVLYHRTMRATRGRPSTRSAAIQGSLPGPTDVSSWCRSRCRRTRACRSPQESLRRVRAGVLSPRRFPGAHGPARATPSFAAAFVRTKRCGASIRSPVERDGMLLNCGRP